MGRIWSFLRRNLQLTVVITVVITAAAYFSGLLVTLLVTVGTLAGAAIVILMIVLLWKTTLRARAGGGTGFLGRNYPWILRAIGLGVLIVFSFFWIPFLYGKRDWLADTMGVNLTGNKGSDGLIFLVAATIAVTVTIIGVLKERKSSVYVAVILGIFAVATFGFMWLFPDFWIAYVQKRWGNIFYMMLILAMLPVASFAGEAKTALSYGLWGLLLITSTVTVIQIGYKPILELKSDLDEALTDTLNDKECYGQETFRRKAGEVVTAQRTGHCQVRIKVHSGSIEVRNRHNAVLPKAGTPARYEDASVGKIISGTVSEFTITLCVRDSPGQDQLICGR